MSCREFARAEVERPAVAVSNCCSVGLCKEHLVEMHRSPTTPPFTCLNQPERGFDTLTAGSKGRRSPAPRRAA